MKDCKIYFFTAFFICLTVVKLCFPAMPAQVGREVARLICCHADYSEAIQAMGKAIGQGQLVQVLNDLRPKGGSGLISVSGKEGNAEGSRSPAPGPELE